MNIDKCIRDWARITESQISEMDDIDIDRDTWKKDDTTTQGWKDVGEKYRNVLNKIDGMSGGAKMNLILWLMELLQKSYASQQDFENGMKKIQNDETPKFTMTSIHREILDAISTTLEKNHREEVVTDIRKEIGE